jgi:hypothetical protein
MPSSGPEHPRAGGKSRIGDACGTPDFCRSIPCGVAVAVDAVVIRDFVAGAELQQGDHIAVSGDHADKGGRFAVVVDEPLGGLHQYHLAAGQIVAVMLELCLRRVEGSASVTTRESPIFRMISPGEKWVDEKTPVPWIEDSAV